MKRSYQNLVWYTALLNNGRFFESDDESSLENFIEAMLAIIYWLKKRLPLVRQKVVF